jgi:hypothetical protein
VHSRNCSCGRRFDGCTPGEPAPLDPPRIARQAPADIALDRADGSFLSDSLVIALPWGATEPNAALALSRRSERSEKRSVGG